MSQNLIFDRTAQRRSRDRAAATFSDHVFLYDRVATDVVERLAVTLRQFNTCVVLGGANGGVARAVSELPSVGRVISTDMSERLVRCGPPPGVVCDEELVPFAAESLDLVVAPLSLHHVNDLPGSLIQIRRALKPDGLLLATLFGGDTLSELRTSLMIAEEEISGGVSPRVAPFADVRQLGGLLQRAGLALPVADSEQVRVRYGTLEKLMQDLRGMALANHLVGRTLKFTPRSLFRRAAEVYAERFSDEGRLVATFEIVTITGWTPHESQQKPLAPGSAKVRLADALGGREISAGDKVGGGDS